LISKIISILNNDGIVAIPTDTVYGLIGDPESRIAVEKVYNVKKREKGKKMSIFLKNHREILKICKTTKIVEDFIFNDLKNNTIILEKMHKNYLSLISDENIGIRIPNNDFLIQLLIEYNKPLFATSINLSGQKEMLYYDEIKQNFDDKIDLIIENKGLSSNKSSSIFSFKNEKLLQIR
jgi:L-threonylcarbamoyladenylate synthase